MLVKTRSISFDREFHNILLYEVSVSLRHFKFVKDFLYHLEYYDIYAFRQIVHFLCGLLLYEVSVSLWHFQVCKELPVSSGMLRHLFIQSDNF